MSIINSELLQAIAKGYHILKCGSVVNPKGKIVQGYLTKAGYFRVNFRIQKKVASFFVHRMQAYQKYGEIIFLPKVQVRHKDGNSKNNSDENILIGTQTQNMGDRPPEERMRTALIATSHWRKYDKEAVKAHYAENGFKKTMEHFGITSKGTMSYIINH